MSEQKKSNPLSSAKSSIEGISRQMAGGRPISQRPKTTSSTEEEDIKKYGPDEIEMQLAMEKIPRHKRAEMARQFVIGPDAPIPVKNAMAKSYQQNREKEQQKKTSVWGKIKKALGLGEENIEEAKSPAWQRKEGKNPEGGLNPKGVASYRAQHPGSKLQTAVTTDPKKLKKGSKKAKRRLSFCRRMKGMKKKLTSAKTARDPDSRINKSLRKWNC